MMPEWYGNPVLVAIAGVIVLLTLAAITLPILLLVWMYRRLMRFAKRRWPATFREHRLFLLVTYLLLCLILADVAYAYIRIPPELLGFYGF